MTAKPKPMKPVRMWAVIDGRGILATSELFYTRADAQLRSAMHGSIVEWSSQLSPFERVAKVEIREIRRKPAKGK